MDEFENFNCQSFHVYVLNDMIQWQIIMTRNVFQFLSFCLLVTLTIVPSLALSLNSLSLFQSVYWCNTQSIHVLLPSMGFLSVFCSICPSVCPHFGLAFRLSPGLFAGMFFNPSVFCLVVYFSDFEDKILQEVWFFNFADLMHATPMDSLIFDCPSF